MVTPNRNVAAETAASFVDPLSTLAHLATLGGKLPLALAHTVYHGSPHTFDAFDASKIGTGEGAQAYGHGLYFAESPGVAESYIDSNMNLGSPSWFAKFIHDDNGGNIDNAIEAARSLVKSGEAPQEALNILLDSKKSGEGFMPGALYTADIPDEWLPKMLHQNKILSEQPESVQQLAKLWGVEPKGSGDVFGIDVLTEARKRFGGDIGAADALSARGIPGTSYLDGSSRRAGEGTYNYVIFPGMEDKVKILNRNGKQLK